MAWRRPLHRLVLLLVVAAVVLAVAGSFAAAAESSAASRGAATEYVDETEWRQACARHKLEVAMLTLDRDTVRRADELRERETPLEDKTFLGSHLQLSAMHTGIPVSMTLSKAGTVVDGNGFLFREKGANHMLQLSSKPAHDSLRIEFSTRIYHEGTRYRQLFAVGLEINEENHTGKEKLAIWDLWVSLPLGLSGFFLLYVDHPPSSGLGTARQLSSSPLNCHFIYRGTRSTASQRLHARQFTTRCLLAL